MENSNAMTKHNRLWSMITAEEASLLRVELLQRAASGYEQIGFLRDAAQCWVEQGDQHRAGALYAQDGDLGRAARAWLQAGSYREALSAYRQWEQQLAQGDTWQRLQALLGQSACHVLGTRASSPVAPDFSAAVGREAYSQARGILVMVHKSKQVSFVANCWEALGEYGGWLGRYDLVQEGYERALVALEASEERTRQMRICRAYLAQARAHMDRLLCQQLQARLAAWPEAEKSPLIAPFPVEQLRLLRTLSGHTNWVRSVAISADGQWLVSGSRDNTIKVWKLSSGEEVRTLSGHTNGVLSVAISADGQWLVSGSYDRTIKVWKLSSGEEVRTLSGHTNSVYSVAISADGQWLVSGSVDETIKVWKLSSGEEVRTLSGHSGSVLSVAISADGQWLVSGSSDRTIKVWKLSSGEEVRTLTGHTDGVWSVAISADGQWLVSGSWDDTIKIWDLSTGMLVRTLTDHSGDVNCVAISPDGRTLVSGSDDRTIKLWGV